MTRKTLLEKRKGEFFSMNLYEHHGERFPLVTWLCT